MRGTAITVRVPDEWLKTLERDVARAAKHYPVPVTWNGAVLPQEDWLKDAVHVEEWYGVRIGVFQKHPSHYSSRDGRLNFHGLTIPCDLPYVQEVDRGGHWIARVDIFDAPPWATWKSPPAASPTRSSSLRECGTFPGGCASPGALPRTGSCAWTMSAGGRAVPCDSPVAWSLLPRWRRPSFASNP